MQCRTISNELDSQVWWAFELFLFFFPEVLFHVFLVDKKNELAAEKMNKVPCVVFKNAVKLVGIPSFGNWLVTMQYRTRSNELDFQIWWDFEFIFLRTYSVFFS